jgi:3-methyladenine DNA glycosylase AlkC
MYMNILNDLLEQKIQTNVINGILKQDFKASEKNIIKITEELHANIPANKRISYGITFVIKVLGKYLYEKLIEIDVLVYDSASHLFEISTDFRSKSVALEMLSFYGLSDYEKVLGFFQDAASSQDWVMREFAQMSFRKLIKKYPDEMSTYLLSIVTSEDANIRRFVGETLRPVQENQWFYSQPDYPLTILKNMFREKTPYPRTSMGNNLSDLSRHLSELVLGLVKDLVGSNDKNSYWIAYRACRNLVKNEPVRVMDLLKVDEYKYKDRLYQRSEY